MISHLYVTPDLLRLDSKGRVYLRRSDHTNFRTQMRGVMMAFGRTNLTSMRQNEHLISLTPFEFVHGSIV